MRPKRSRFEDRDDPYAQQEHQTPKPPPRFPDAQHYDDVARPPAATSGSRGPPPFAPPESEGKFKRRATDNRNDPSTLGSASGRMFDDHLGGVRGNPDRGRTARYDNDMGATDTSVRDQTVMTLAKQGLKGDADRVGPRTAAQIAPGDKDPLSFAKRHGITREELEVLDNLVVRARFKPESCADRIEWVMKRLVSERYLGPRGLAMHLYDMGMQFVWVRRPVQQQRRGPRREDEKPWFAFPFYGTEQDWLKYMRCPTVHDAFAALSLSVDISSYEEEVDQGRRRPRFRQRPAEQEEYAQGPGPRFQPRAHEDDYDA